MERAEAEAIYARGREVAVETLVELAAQNALLRQQVEQLSERVARQDARIARQDARIAELERRLSQNSRNSSTPPSQDPPSVPSRERAPGSGRGPGGQPGHPGHHRPLECAESVDELIDHWPERCGCGHLFSAGERIPSGEPARHQVSELPAIAVLVTEHREQRLRCPDCGTTTRAALPAGVPGGAFGPRLEAAVATLSVRNRVSRRDAAELVGELFGSRLSVGTVDAILQRTGAALEQPYAELQDQIRAARAVNVDETGWRQQGKRRTLWGAVTGRAALFRIAQDRHERELEPLIGEDFEGIVCSDRWWAYDRLDPELRQICWSHLIRDFTAHSEGLAEQSAFGEAGLEITERVFCVWHEFQQDGDRARLGRRVTPLKRELKTLLVKAAGKGARQKRTRRFAKNLLKLWPALWTFTEVDGVEPTNNAAERGLRAAVIYRKLSLGSQSDAGERMVERMLSASQTCRLQRRSLFAYLADVLAARTRGDPIPLLI
jgi:transposase